MKKWPYEELTAAITTHGLSIVAEKDIQHGKQLVLANGTLANCYGSGKVVVQGKDSDEKNLLNTIINSGNAVATTSVPHAVTASPGTNTIKEPKVFVVYGHDTPARDQLELLLLRMNIKPVILSNMAHKGNIELPSDINGLIYIPFKDSVQQAKNKLAASLQKAGFYIDIEHLSAE